MNNLINKIERQESIEVAMTSDKAKEYLSKFENFRGQRPLKPARVNLHKKTIIDGLFLRSQVVIGYYYENEDHRTIPKSSLIDGHHRIHAISEADSNDPIKLNVLKVYAPKEVIRQLYGYFDSKKSARNLEDILRWKIAFHDGLKDRWNYDHLIKFALALPYASGHFFANKRFTQNAVPMGLTIGKDDFLSDSLDTSSWWWSFDKLDEFLEGLNDRNNATEIKLSLGNVVYGVFLKTMRRIGRDGQALNKTLDFWKTTVDSLLSEAKPPLFDKLWDMVKAARLAEASGNVGKGGSVPPIFYAFSKAHESYMSDNVNLGITYSGFKSIDQKDKKIIKDVFAKGELISVIHPVYKENRLWERENRP